MPRGTHDWTGISRCRQSVQSKPGTLGKHQSGGGNANGTRSVMQPGKVPSVWPSRAGKVGPAGRVPVTPESFAAGKVGRSGGSGWAAQEARCLQGMLAIPHIPWIHPIPPSHFYRNGKLLQVHKVQLNGVAQPSYSGDPARLLCWWRL